MYVVYTRIDEAREYLLSAWSASSAPPAYRERLARMQSSSARAHTRAGLWLLGAALAAQGIDASALDRIGLAGSGRPWINGVPAFSISHSGALVVCALAAGAMIGVDVEVRRPIVPARLRRLLSAEEAAAVTRAPACFFDFWCAREATVKASGRVGLARIRSLTLHGDHARLDDREWPLRPLELAPGYAGCLASDQPIDAVEIVERVIPMPG